MKNTYIYRIALIILLNAVVSVNNYTFAQEEREPDDGIFHSEYMDGHWVTHHDDGTGGGSGSGGSGGGTGGGSGGGGNDDGDDNWGGDSYDDDEDWKDPYLTFDPDDDPDPHSDDPDPDCYNRLKSETQQSSTIGKQRRKIAIGEDVDIWVENFKCPAVQITWSIINKGTQAEFSQKGNKGAITTFNAGYYPGTLTIRATFSGNSVGNCLTCPTYLDLSFEVIEPKEIYYEPVAVSTCSGQTLFHDYNRPSAGFVARMYFLPDDVNFYNVEYRETKGNVTCEDIYWDGLPCEGHSPFLGYLPCWNIVEKDKGTRANEDVIMAGWLCHGSTIDKWDGTLPGTTTNRIPLEYLRIDSQNNLFDVKFLTVEQKAVNEIQGFGNNPQFTISKGKTKKQTRLEDATTTCPIRGGCN